MHVRGALRSDEGVLRQERVEAVTARLNKADLRRLWTSLTRLLPPQQLPTEPAEIIAIHDLREVVARMIVDYAPVLERGELVFSWRVPREQALTMNAYAHKKGWMKKKLRVELDRQVNDLLDLPRDVVLGTGFPHARLNGAKKRRWLRVTRFSTQRVDDLSIDILGGKMPVDALVRCGILADDNDAMAFREPRWEKTARGNTHVLVEVFEIREEGTHEDDASPPAIVKQLTRKKGEFTKYIEKG